VLLGNYLSHPEISIRALSCDLTQITIEWFFTAVKVGAVVVRGKELNDRHLGAPRDRVMALVHSHGIEKLLGGLLGLTRDGGEERGEGFFGKQDPLMFGEDRLCFLGQGIFGKVGNGLAKQVRCGFCTLLYLWSDTAAQTSTLVFRDYGYLHLYPILPHILDEIHRQRALLRVVEVGDAHGDATVVDGGLGAEPGGGPL